MMDEDLYNLNRELRGLRNDKKMTENAVLSEINRWSDLIKNGMGEDMNNVLTGKTKVKLPLKDRIKFKLSRLFKKKKEDVTIDPMYGIREFNV